MSYASVKTAGIHTKDGTVSPRSLNVEAITSFCADFLAYFKVAIGYAKELLKAKIEGFKSNLIGECFPIIIDECDEFFCHPKYNPQYRITLYRAFNLAMMEIKESKIVAICVGTKFSSNDVVINYRSDASARPDPVS